MARLIPDVEAFKVETDRRWRANLKIPRGLGGLQMRMRFIRLEEERPRLARLLATGDSVAGRLDMDAAFALVDRGCTDQTMLCWRAIVRISGPVGSMGQRVLRPVISERIRCVLVAIEHQLEVGCA